MSKGPRRIYLMADYSSSSLWTDEPNHFMVSLDSLPLSLETKRALEAWSQQLWDLSAAGRDEAEEEAWFRSERFAELNKAHEAEGPRLWRLVRQELGPDYEVGYAVFDPHPDDSLGSTKRIVWDPTDH